MKRSSDTAGRPQVFTFQVCCVPAHCRCRDPEVAGTLVGSISPEPLGWPLPTCPTSPESEPKSGGAPSQQVTPSLASQGSVSLCRLLMHKSCRPCPLNPGLRAPVQTSSWDKSWQECWEPVCLVEDLERGIASSWRVPPSSTSRSVSLLTWLTQAGLLPDVQTSHRI